MVERAHSRHLVTMGIPPLMQRAVSQEWLLPDNQPRLLATCPPFAPRTRLVPVTSERSRHPRSGDDDVEQSDQTDAWEVLKASFDFFSEGLRTSLTAARRLIEHQGELGEDIEESVHLAIRSLIPARYAFGKGEVVNGLGSRSRQQDLVITDTEAVSSIGKRRIIPFEAIVASIEVKTSLDSGQISGAVRNVQSVKELAGLGQTRERGPLVPFGGIIGLSVRNSETAAIKSYCEACAKIPEPSERPDALLIVGQAAVMPGIERGEGRLAVLYWSDPEAAPGQQVVFKGAEASALFFFYRLLEHVKQYLPPQFNFLSYARKTQWRYQIYTPDDLKDRVT